VFLREIPVAEFLDRFPQRHILGRECPFGKGAKSVFGVTYFSQL
jgi:hypothetical protein